ncbi:hypothetical protein KVR01_013830 [Diaporthe batatas]|uniref:uncharacterized protein n=1 Tax=Diaporthe batatas TaxID=748121 RepID=UPI001D04460B|nr:uncharacterized protein KVR01_013830 [Diaporthe batatas]KAG8156295.1 hypothetical protein KVR01_013830 [Diaporthe batatas]
MADRKPDNIPSDLVKVGTLTEPRDNATTTAMPSLTGNQSSSSSDDPPPPLPKILDQPTQAEDLALENWIKRNTSYISTIPWHRYAQMPVLSWLWGYPDADFRHDCVSSYMFYTRAVRRKLTDDERDGVLEPAARSAAAASYDRPIATGLGAWLMSRSWAKSGTREAVRRAAEEAAAATATAGASHHGMGTGTVGADGHITHFSTPQQQQHAGTGARFGFGGGSFNNIGSRGRAVGQLFRRAGRASVPGLLCFVGLQVLGEPYRLYLSDNEAWTMHSDIRLMGLFDDMEKTMAAKAGEIEDLLRRRGY